MYAAFGWRTTPLRRMRDLITPKLGLAILVTALFALALIVGVVATVALPGETLYILKQVFRAFCIHLFLGFLLGLALGLWVSYPAASDGLAGQKARLMHRLCGLSLLVLFLAVVLYGPIERLLPRLSGISTSVVSLDFDKGSRNDDELPVAQFEGGSGGKDLNTNARKLAINYLNFVNIFSKRDHNYIRHIRGDISQISQPLANTNLLFTPMVAECFGIAIRNRRYLRDAGAIQAKFGSAVAYGAQWFRSVLARTEEEQDSNSTSLWVQMYKRLPARCMLPRVLPQTLKEGEMEREVLELPYFALTLAHMMHLADRDLDGAHILALWIDRSQRKDLRQKIENWHRIRAYIHLSILFERVGPPPEKRDMLRQSVELFEETLQVSPIIELRHLKKWAKICKKHNGYSSEQNSVFHRIRFTFMSLSSRWIESALDSGKVTAGLLKHAKRNTSMPVSCYPAKQVDIIASSKAGFLVVHARLLMALAARQYFILPEGGKDMKAYRDARQYLLKALALLRPLERKEGVKNEDRPAGHVVDGYSAEHTVREAEEQLKYAEAALGLQ